MKTKIFALFFITITILLCVSCGKKEATKNITEANKVVPNVKITDSEIKHLMDSINNTLSDEEKAFCVKTLRAYFNSDSLQSELLESAKYKKIAALQRGDTTDIVSHYRYYIQIAVKIDSLSKLGIELLNKNENDSLLNMLEANQVDFRVHPSNNNNIEQDWKFCAMKFILNQHIFSEEKAINEYLDDTELISLKLQFNYDVNDTLLPLYIPFYEDRAMAYSRVNNIPKAMEILNKLLSDVKNILGKKSEEYKDSFIN